MRPSQPQSKREPSAKELPASGMRSWYFRRAALPVIAFLLFAAGWMLGARREHSSLSPHPKDPLVDSQPDIRPHKYPKWDESTPLARALEISSIPARTRALLALVEKTPVQKLAALIEKSERAPSNLDDGLLRRFAYTKWAEADPAAAFAHASAKEGKRRAPDQVITVWSSTHPQAAFEAALAYSIKYRNLGVVQNALDNWAGQDAPAALAAWGTVPKDLRDETETQTFFTNLAATDPGLALKTALALDKYREEAVQGCFDGIAAMDPQGAKDVLLTLEDRQLQRKIGENVTYQLADEDPVGALKLIADLDLPRHSYITQSIFESWAKRDLPAALQAADGFPDLESKVSAYGGILETLDDEDQAKAFELFDKAGTALQVSIRERSQFLENATQKMKPAEALAILQKYHVESSSDLFVQALRRMAKDDPRAAATALATISPNHYSLDAVVREWADEDPRQALAWVQDTALGGGRADLVKAVYESMIKKDPLAAGMYLDALPPTIGKDEFVGQIMDAMVADDPRSAADWLMKNTSGALQAKGMETLLKLLNNTYQSDNSPLAMEIIAQMPPGTLPTRVLAESAAIWTRSDPEAAIKWAEALPIDSPLHNQALETILSTWAGTNPTEAAAHLKENLSTLNEASATAAVETLAARFAEVDYSKGMEWAQTLPEGALRDAAAATAITTYAAREPAAAWELAQQLSPGTGRDNALAAAANQMSRIDLQSATGMLEALPPGKSQDNAVIQVAYWWLQSNETVATQWAGNLSAGPVRDTVIEALVSKHIGDRPAAESLALALTIGDNQKRFDAIIGVASPWRYGDLLTRTQALQSAFQAAEEGNFSPERKAMLLEQLRRIDPKESF